MISASLQHWVFLLFSFVGLTCSFQISPRTSGVTRTSALEMSTEINRKSFLASSATLATSLILNPSISQAEETTNGGIATFALRRAGATKPSIANLPPNKNGIFVRLGEGLLYSDDGSRTPGKDVFCSFDFPADWLQLDRILGGIQYVDQRNGDKLYVLKVKMPEGVSDLKDVPKAYFGNAIFDPKGELVRTGNTVEEFKVLSSQMLSGTAEEGSASSKDEVARRRLKVRYTTLTGNNFSVERKGLVDAYEVGGMVYMLLTGSNAVLFDKKGRERDTVEYIADSFRVQPVYAAVV